MTLRKLERHHSLSLSLPQGTQMSHGRPQDKMTDKDGSLLPTPKSLHVTPSESEGQHGQQEGVEQGANCEKVL